MDRNKLFSKVLFLSLLLIQRNFVLCKTCKAPECNSVKFPLLDNHKAYLFAEMDVSSMNEQLKEFIQNEINVTCNDRIEEFETKQRILGNSVSEMYNKNLRLSKDTFDQQLENLTIIFQMSQTSNNEKIQSFVNNSMAQIDRHILHLTEEFEKKQEEMKKKILAEHTAKLHNLNILYEEKIANFTRDTCKRIEMMSESIVQEKPNSIVKEKELNNTKEAADSTGKMFYLAFMRTFSAHPKYVQLYMISNTNGNCRIRIPYLNIDASVAVRVYNDTPYRINSNIIMTTAGIQKKAILVSCDVSVSIYGMSYANIVTEGYLGIPHSGLGCRYIVSSFSTDMSEFGFVATSNNTFVSIILRFQYGSLVYNGQTYRSGDTLNLVISEHETFLLYHSSDLSGTIIASTKPIAVVSGCRLSFMNKEYSNHMTEMILPHKHLGRHYIVPVLYNSQCNFRVYADSPLNFTVMQGNISQTEIKHLTTGQFIEVTNYKPTTIRSSTGILVQLYCDTNGLSYDSVMVTLPAIQHFKASYKFVAVSDFPPGYQPNSYYITVIIQTNAIDGLQFDGVSSLSFIQASSIGMSGQSYSILIKEISKGLHTITQVRNVPFGLIINGKTTHQGYAYPAGFLFNSGV